MRYPKLCPVARIKQGSLAGKIVALGGTSVSQQFFLAYLTEITPGAGPNDVLALMREEFEPLNECAAQLLDALEVQS